MRAQIVDGKVIESNNEISVGTRIHGCGTVTKEYKTVKPQQAMCRGCRDDFYNYGNNSTSGRCWAFDSSRVVNKVGYSSLHRDNGPDVKMVKTLDCWHAVVK